MDILFGLTTVLCGGVLARFPKLRVALLEAGCGFLPYYLERLAATPDGDGSLLDHMTILYGSGISNSTRHSGVDLPLMLVGGGVGRLPSGRHLRFTDEPSMANLLVTLMDKMGVKVIHTTPFHRHHFADVMEAIDMIRARDYPPRGNV